METYSSDRVAKPRQRMLACHRFMNSSVLSKCLPLLFLPLGAALLMLLAALRWRTKSLIATPLLLLSLLGMPAISNLLMSSLEDHFPYLSNEECPHADAIFVFGGMLSLRSHKGGGIEWNEAAERFYRAVDLYKAGRADVLVLSGGPETYPGGPDEGGLLKKKQPSWVCPMAQLL